MRLDYEASAAALAGWLARIKANDWTPTEAAREYRALARQLETVADLLDEPRWVDLESEIETGDTNAGRYQGAIMRLREIAEEAARMADEYPNARAKPELSLAAAYFLHLWYHAGRERPALYDNSEAVGALADILTAGGYVLSPARVRGILAQALETFDPHLTPPGFDSGRFLVWCQ
jgi:hypothetical protein